MIYYVKREDLSVEKYDACIEKSINSRIYAFSWYLDIVADHWDALVLNDYEAVMPLPWRSKYFIKYVYPPAWTQQLGVFSSKEISEDLIGDFINAIPKKFKKITIQLNAGNKIIGKNISEKVNYILPLDKPYEELFKGFRKDRKERIKKNEICLIAEDNLAIQLLLAMFKNLYSNKFLIRKDDSNKLELLADQLNKKKLVSIKVIYNHEKQLIAGAVFLTFNNRIYYLFSAQNEEGKASNSLSIILNKVIKENSNTTKILDFEGSIIPNIADFFKSFGAEKEVYSLITIYK
ncbi:MAG: hypothetical protein Q7U08_02770 [Flavobacteriaceae bacterium]|nr:hypothetical protein [Flavobacteriaceae bacterium]